ncbi:MAG TPA: OB-fold nucleic acid binding domain-containing protein, partial [Candidatus Paceibacterota bacterium]|nr:OB-fold nucleic acid binding domain-containing protein [Candidatus Paceibacterota bacterium]
SLESLIKCGALDSFDQRGTLLLNIETLLAFHRDTTAEAPQDSLFGAFAATPTLTLKPGAPVLLKDKLEWEKELLGIYVSGHPLDAHEATLAKAKLTISQIKEDPQPGMPIILPVLVAEVRTLLTKNGEKMAFIKFEDKTESIEAVVFPKLYKEHGLAVTAGTCMLVKGNVSNRNGELSLSIENLKPL